MTRIENAINNLLISTDRAVLSRIEEVKHFIDIPETNSKGYCYCLKVDGNGNLRLQDLIDYIDTRIVDYAIPRKEIDAAKEDFNKTGSTRKILDLRKKAENLFTDLANTGEGGEILLYILTQDILQLPQLISKMSLKTSSKMHYHGADGIHFQYNSETLNLDLYWTEAKMYQDLSTAIAKCFESLKGFLLDPQGYTSTQERDIDLITSNIHQNINNEDLEELLVSFFDKDNELSNNLVYKGVCFIGFDYDKYPHENDISQTTNDIKNAILAEYDKWNYTLSKKIKTHTNLNQKEIHIFLMPFPSVEKFREYYLKTIK
jgi:hypothetical protein